MANSSKSLEAQADWEQALATLTASAQRAERQRTALENPETVAAINRFINVAQKGSGPGASGGELRAYRLAELLRGAIEECPGTDDTVIEGACALLRSAALGGDEYQNARALLARVPTAS